MSRHTGSVCRLCRREGMKLYLKGDRCFKEKCAVERRAYPPGQHGKRRSKIEGYGLQLREKQKVKRLYGVQERQFRLYFQEADRKKGVTGDNLLAQLETRLDNVVYRMGFATSRAQARQLVTHGHVCINGRRMDIASAMVRTGDVVSLRENTRKNPFVVSAVETAAGRGIPAWVELDAKNFTGKVLRAPAREDVTYAIQEQLIVELYSK